jgi:formylglycine-generating enzyme required for sulfatase activity
VEEFGELPTMAAAADPITVLPIPNEDDFGEMETVLPLPDSVAPGAALQSPAASRRNSPPPTDEIDPGELLRVIGSTRPAPRVVAGAQPPSKRPLAIVAVAVVLVAVIAGVVLLRGDDGEGDDAPTVPPTVDVPPLPDGESPVKPVPPVPTTGALAIASEPAGATVFLDDEERGVAPITVSELARGSHSVRVEAPFHESWTVEREVVPGSETAVVARLVRGTGRLALSNGHPGATVLLRRAGTPAKEYRERLDATGALSDLVVEAGEYHLEVDFEGFDSVRQVLTLDRGSRLLRDVTQPALVSKLTVTSVPTGARAALDGKELGTTPLADVPVSAGRHKLTLTHPEHDDLEREFDVAGSDTLRLEGLRLVSWPRLDLSAITDDDVTAWRDGVALRAGRPVPPGVYEVELRRPDHAKQTVTLNAEAGGKARLVAGDWRAFRCELDLGRVPADVTAVLDGAPARGVLRFPAGRVAKLELSRAGYRSQQLAVDLVLGETKSVEPAEWIALTGTVALIGLDDGVTAALDGRALVDGAALPPGTYTVRLSRPGHVAQDVNIEVGAGRTAEVRAGTWRREALSPTEIRGLLTSLLRWDAADDDARTEAARAVAAANPEFVLTGIERHESGGVEHAVAHFSHARSGLEFVLIPVGTFDMGAATAAGDARSHRVTLSAPFFAGVTEVTQKAWKAAVGYAPSEWNGDDRPVEKVSWVEANAFCKQVGLTLPTEAQWEYACRAGVTAAFACGDDVSGVDALAWHFRNSDQRTHPVAKKARNAFGLFDVHGNVREWCLDVVAPYPAAPVTDPAGAQPPGERAVRGGGCLSEPDRVGSAYRAGESATTTSSSLGLRAFAPVRLP